MRSDKEYIFRSERLGFRNWKEDDIPYFSDMNSDSRVMKYFPKLLTPGESRVFVERMEEEYREKGYCYYAVDALQTDLFIGFIGLSYKNFESDFTPCTDIGWRLRTDAWGKGYATEGAKRCLEYAFNELSLEKVIAISPVINKPSIRVMVNIGMIYRGTFDHPFLKDSPELRNCVLYDAGKFHS